jgi:hypothetical protein
LTLRTTARRTAASFGRPGADEREGYVRGGVRGATANPEAARALERLVRDVERARYARAEDGETGRDSTEVAADVETCCAALRAGASKRRRRTATWLPASLVSNGVWHSPSLRRRTGDAPIEVGVDRAT